MIYKYDELICHLLYSNESVCYTKEHLSRIKLYNDESFVLQSSLNDNNCLISNTLVMRYQIRLKA